MLGLFTLCHGLLNLSRDLLLLGDRVYDRQLVRPFGAAGISPNSHYRGECSTHHP